MIEKNDPTIEKQFDLTNKPTGASNETFEDIYDFIKTRYKNTGVKLVDVQIKDKSLTNPTKKHEKLDVSVSPSTTSDEDDFHFIYEKIIIRKNSGSKPKKSKVIKEKRFTVLSQEPDAQIVDSKHTKEVSWEMSL